MDERNRSVLRRYHDKLSRDLIITEGLLAELRAGGIFQTDMIEIIRAQSTPSDKTQKLLELLPKRGPEALDKFIRIIEGNYPWLATVLASAAVISTPKAQERPTKTLSRSSLCIDDQQWNQVDLDIRRIVAAFVHRQFGQSRRVSEKDKKSVERFMADQIQRERARYQSILDSTSASTPISRPDSVLDNDVFQYSEVQEGLFAIHLKLEPYISKCSNGTTTTNTFSQDDDGHPDKRHGSHAQPPPPSSDDDMYHHKPTSDYMDFNLVNTEVDIVLKHIEMFEDVIDECLNYLDSRDHRGTLPKLIQDLVTRVESQQSEMAEDKNQIERLLDEVQNNTDDIEKLERDKVGYKRQVQAAHLDMAFLKQEKRALHEQVEKLKRDKRNQQEEFNEMKLGFVSKSVKTTPKNRQTRNGGGSVAPRNYTQDTTRASLANVSIGSDDGNARRSVIKPEQRPGNTYLAYARRSQGNRHGMANGGAKKKGKNDSFSL